MVADVAARVLVGQNAAVDFLLELVGVVDLVGEQLQQPMVDIGPEYAAAGLAGVVLAVDAQMVRIGRISALRMFADGQRTADVQEVVKGVGLDKRIGKHFLRPGIGYGGSCLPKDVRGLRHLAGANGYRFRLLESVIAINNYQKKRAIEKIKGVFEPQNLQNKTIAVLGLAFKNNTDDIRYSAGIDIIKKLQKLGSKIKTFDPKAMENAKKEIIHKIEFCQNSYEAVKNADLVMIATEWSQFKKLNWKKIKTSLKKPILVDGRNLLDPVKMKKLGFRYIGIGRNI